MQLNSIKRFSSVTVLALATLQVLHAENYVSIEYLQYNENDNRVAVSAPSLSLSYDIDTDYNIQASFVHDAVSGASPTWQKGTADSASGASVRTVNNTNEYTYSNQKFTEARDAGSLILTTRFDNRDELHTGIDFSSESDFESNSFSVDYKHYTDSSHNRSLSIATSISSNELLAYPDTASGASTEESSTSLNTELGLSQVLSQTSSVKISAFALLDSGYLSNPHASVVRDYNLLSSRLANDKRPDKRVAYGLSLNYIKLLLPNLSYQGNYRFYTDDWAINSHTINNYFNYQLNKQIILGTGLRYYTQSSADFYNPSKDFFTNQTYASSDERLSSFNALTYKGSIDFKQDDEISYNFGAEYYSQSTGLSALMITTGVKYNY